MTRPEFLPPLPHVTPVVPPDGFATAVRAAGRRRWRDALAAGGGALAVAAVLALPGGPGGTAGLEPVTPPGPAASPSVPATAGIPRAAAPAPPRDAPGTAPPPPSAAPSPAASPSPTPEGAPEAMPGPVGTVRPKPWTRSPADADTARLATCVGADPGAGGTRHGDWCLTAFASEQPAGVALSLEACPVVPDAAPLRFADGRELDLVVRAGTTQVWSAATGRTFPAAGTDADPPYGECVLWRVLWDGVADDGTRVPPGTYAVRAALRLVDRAPADEVGLTLGG